MSTEVLALIAAEPLPEIIVVADVEALFRAHYARLVRALTVVSGDRELAADAVQEAFVKAHMRWKRLRHYDDPVGWIRRVAINQLRDDHRRAARKERALTRLAATSPTAVVDEHRDDDIATLLAALPRQQRVCLALFYVDGLPIAEIAAALELEEGTVKYHLHQGRERLRDRLSDDERRGGPPRGGPR